MDSAAADQRKYAASTRDTASLEQVVQRFFNFGLPTIHDPSTWLSFEQLTRLISQPGLISSTADILNQILTTKPKKPLVRARVFLSAYLISTCQNVILQDTPEDIAQQMHTASKQLLDRFEAWLTSSADYTDDITPSWKRYARLFEIWKVKDHQQLLESTIAHYYGLLDLRNSVDQGSLHKNSFDRRDALQILDDQLRNVQEKVESLGGTVHQETRHRHEIPTPPETDYSDKEQLYHQKQQPEVQRLLSRLTMEQKQAKLTNEQLAHELVVDPDFRLTRPPEGCLERRVAIAASKAFFDQLVQDMNKDNLLEVLSDLHKRLDQVVPLLEKDRLAEVMDFDLIKQQLDTNSFDLDAMIEFVLDRMAMSCAPVRDAAIQAIRQDAPTIADRLYRIMEVLQEMALDLANIQLISLRPHLLPIAVQYGRDQFQKSHPPGMCDLVRTRAWLATGSKQDVIKNSPRGRFDDAFASLITTWTDEEMIPEVLVCDMIRIRQFQQTSLTITTVGTLVILAKSFGMQGEQDALVTRLRLLVQNDTTTVDHLCSEVLRYCTTNATTVTAEDSALARSMVDKTLNHKDPVFRLLQRRVASVIKHYLSYQRTMPAMKTLESYGLDCLASELERLCERVEAFADYNYHVHEETIRYLLT